MNEQTKYKERVDITKARCELCKREVKPQLNFSQSWTQNHKMIPTVTLSNYINSYWSCEAHGAVGATIGKEHYTSPEELFDYVLFRGKKIKVRDSHKIGGKEDVRTK